MRILTKGLMGAFVAASVLGTTPLHAGVTTPAKAPGYHEFDQASDFYRKRKDRRHYARDERIDRDTRIWSDNNGRYRCKTDNGTTGLLIGGAVGGLAGHRSEEPTSELQSLMRISYAVFCLKKKKNDNTI